MRVLVVNAGSSSVKLRVIDEQNRLTAGVDLPAPADGLIDQVADFVRPLAAEVDVAGHRVVHGGPRYTRAVVVDDQTRSDLEGVSELAPLHNPAALHLIDATRAILPGVPSVACFDTSFHSTLPAGGFPLRHSCRVGRSLEYTPLRVSRVELRLGSRSGRRAPGAPDRRAPAGDLSPRKRRLRHGRGGRPFVDTTMGYTPMEGLVMAWSLW